MSFLIISGVACTSPRAEPAMQPRNQHLELAQGIALHFKPQSTNGVTQNGETSHQSRHLQVDVDCGSANGRRVIEVLVGEGIRVSQPQPQPYGDHPCASVASDLSISRAVIGSKWTASKTRFWSAAGCCNNQSLLIPCKTLRNRLNSFNLII